MFICPQTPRVGFIGAFWGKVMSDAASYPLGYTEAEARRLADQSAFYEDLTIDVLRRASIGSAMRVLDLGCGVGDVSFLAAQLVGTNGTVLGIDRSASSVETAHGRATALGVRNVQFKTAGLDSFDTEQTFDAVIGRFVLCFQPDAGATLRHFRRFLKSDGIIAFQELDVEQISQAPPSELFSRVRSWIIAALKSAGIETNMGSRLLGAFLDAGLPRPTMIAASRAESGPDSRIYRAIADFIRTLLPILERGGVATAEEVAIDTLADRLRQEAVAKERVTFSGRLVGAWSRLSN